MTKAPAPILCTLLDLERADASAGAIDDALLDLAAGLATLSEDVLGTGVGLVLAVWGAVAALAAGFTGALAATGFVATGFESDFGADLTTGLTAGLTGAFAVACAAVCATTLVTNLPAGFGAGLSAALALGATFAAAALAAGFFAAALAVLGLAAFAFGLVKRFSSLSGGA